MRTISLLAFVSSLGFSTGLYAQGSIKEFFFDELAPRIVDAGGLEVACLVENQCIDAACTEHSDNSVLVVKQPEDGRSIDQLPVSEIAALEALLWMGNTLLSLEGGGNVDHFWGLGIPSYNDDLRASFVASLQGGQMSLTLQNTKTMQTISYFGTCEAES
ncbi:hypothetical protein [Roseobacter sinensis]|uniref:Uncharacterized protein n=1 Tax=Roseobacter sinensis TaxID=2931391 RepID=A0ABT3BB97_9RHOB|nr:hypothetical protein [Roseobacter sp. WL0113]MCV3270843.1 hypothetical protein [Roseobacter sp. WL0113]